MKLIVTLLVLFVFVGCSDSPVKSEGRFFIVEWIVPDDVIFYKGFISSNKDKIKQTLYSCQELRMPPPLKAGRKQEVVINYKLETFTFNLYVRILAFDIDGNYWNLNLLHFEKEGIL